MLKRTLPATRTPLVSGYVCSTNHLAGGSLQLIRRFRIPALFCALAVLLCELISRPYANMGVCDDWPYILMAQHLAATGHVVYNAWAAPMLGWQLYLAAALIKLFGFSFTTVRVSTLLISMALAFLLQRTLVRANLSEFNSTLGTLALVLSPLYLMLSVIFMTDIPGLFALILCLYGCLRALQAPTSRATILWLCFAVATNALFGTARQIAWLGILVMVPSALWLLRASRRVLLSGAAVNLAGALFVFACVHWLKHQPYTIPEHLLLKSYPVGLILSQFIHTFLDIPFLLLPIAALFLPQIRKSRPAILALFAVLSVGYILLAIHQSHVHPNALLEPTEGDFVNPGGTFPFFLQGEPPVFLHTSLRIVLTILSLGGLLGLIASLLRLRDTPPQSTTETGITWKQLGILLGPYSLAYAFLLIPSATIASLVDRYTFGLLVVALLCLLRYYQERIQDQNQPHLPLVSLFLLLFVVVYGIAYTHNLFALERARVDLAAELRAHGVPDISVDNGWEYNLGVELQHARYINISSIEVPANAYVPQPPLPPGTCPTYWYDRFPHIHARYGISFDPNACYGPAPFAPVHYTRWLASSPGTLYVVKYTPRSKP
jgi:hypothetical protein